MLVISLRLPVAGLLELYVEPYSLGTNYRTKRKNIAFKNKAGCGYSLCKVKYRNARLVVPLANFVPHQAGARLEPGEAHLPCIPVRVGDVLEKAKQKPTTWANYGVSAAVSNSDAMAAAGHGWRCQSWPMMHPSASRMYPRTAFGPIRS